MNKIFIFLLTVLLTTSLHAQQASVEARSSNFDLNEFTHVAIGGYDPVAYFDVGEAIKGTPKLGFTYQGVKYHFSTEENRKKFIAETIAYEPQYGGWCAYAMAKKRKIKADPTNFVVKDGKLYLFYKSRSGNVKDRWEVDPAKYIEPSDRSWAEILGISR